MIFTRTILSFCFALLADPISTLLDGVHAQCTRMAGDHWPDTCATWGLVLHAGSR